MVETVNNLLMNMALAGFEQADFAVFVPFVSRIGLANCNKPAACNPTNPYAKLWPPGFLE
jgi:hypothetical protein